MPSNKAPLSLIDGRLRPPHPVCVFQLFKAPVWEGGALVSTSAQEQWKEAFVRPAMRRQC